MRWKIGKKVIGTATIGMVKVTQILGQLHLQTLGSKVGLKDGVKATLVGQTLIP